MHNETTEAREMPDAPSAVSDDTYDAKRRALIAKLAASAFAAPVILTTLSTKAAAASR